MQGSADCRAGDCDTMSSGRARSGMAVVALAGALAACVGAMPLGEFAGAGPAMRPEQFFAGATRGWGVLETRGGRPSQRFTVEGRGATAADGSFGLEQTVRWGDGRVEQRAWRLVADGPQRYRGTLTDARGAVTAEIVGNVFHLRYRLADPAVMMEQHLYLQADGRSVLNSATVTVMGMPVAHLTETIVRVP